MEHWHMSHGHSWSNIKLNYLMCAMCMVSKSWNYWFIKNVNIGYCATWTLILHTCMTYGILLFVNHPTYWMDQTIFFWICPNVFFLPWEIIKHNLQIGTSSQCFSIDSTKNCSTIWFHIVWVSTIFSYYLSNSIILVVNTLVGLHLYGRH